MKNTGEGSAGQLPSIAEMSALTVTAPRDGPPGWKIGEAQEIRRGPCSRAWPSAPSMARSKCGWPARLSRRTLEEASAEIARELDEHRAALDELTQRVVENGLAVWAGDGSSGNLIIKGQARLLDDVTAIEDLERIRALFDALETKESLLRLVDAAEASEGVQIFVGAENELFSHTGWSMILAPYRSENEKVVGAIGVIGPTRLNYARIIPMVDYTAKVIGRLLG